MTKPTYDPELVERANAGRMAHLRALGELLDLLGDRLPGRRRNAIRNSLFEDGLALNLLVQALIVDRVPLSSTERETVARLLAEFGTGGGRQPYLEDHTGALAVLTVLDENGRQLSPPPGFDPVQWVPRRLASALYGRGGGHMHGIGMPHRTAFPASWGPDQINDTVLDVARNPDERPEQTRAGGWITRGTRDGVVLEARLRGKGTILTGYALSGPGVERVGMVETDPVEPERRTTLRADVDALHEACVPLVDALAPRLPDLDARRVRTGLHVGEFVHLVDDLLATLVQEQIPITTDEHALLITALDRLGLGDEDSPFLRDRDATLAATVVG